jgi:hypothetical protein
MLESDVEQLKMRRTFREPLEALNLIIGWDQTKNGIKDRLESATDKIHEAWDEAGTKLGIARSNLACLYSLMFFQTALDLCPSFRMVQ